MLHLISKHIEADHRRQFKLRRGKAADKFETDI